MLDRAELERIKLDRSTVYGEPKENHRGIAMMWSALLQPHAERIGKGEPLPAWTVALLLAALKLDRMRLAYRRDNFIDAANYLSFVEAWQAEWEEECGDKGYTSLAAWQKEQDDQKAEVRAQEREAERQLVAIKHQLDCLSHQEYLPSGYPGHQPG